MPHGRHTGDSAVRSRGNREYARELLRAAAGSTLFAFPLLMTMEMWWLGFSADRTRLIVFIIFGLGLLYGLSYFAGFARTSCTRDDVMDALSALAIGVIVSIVLMALFGVVSMTTPLDESLGKIAIQAIPAGMGAILARKQFGSTDDDQDDTPRSTSYGAEIFLMFGGAVFIAFNVAPTDEMSVISHMITPWHAMILAVLSVSVLHLLVYHTEFAGQEDWPDEHGFLKVFYRFSLAGYGIALLVSLYILWTFGRTDGMHASEIAMMTIVLGFPASLGAATARLVI